MQIFSRLSSIRLTPQHDRPWFYFDVQFYIAQCMAIGLTPSIDSHEAYLRHYLEIGGRRFSLSPNPLFEEEYYRKRHPGVAAEIQIGKWACGFDHFVHQGSSDGLSPNWFFDGGFYRAFHADLTDENLQIGQFGDLYSHFIHVGIGERRIAHWLIKGLMQIAPGTIMPKSASALLELLVNDQAVASLLEPVLNYSWVKERYSLPKQVTSLKFPCFYLNSVVIEALSPSPYFDEQFYRNQYPEIRNAIDSGSFSSGYEHFLLHGLNELRQPFAGFDPVYYSQYNMSTTTNPQNGSFGPSPYIHFLLNKKKGNLRISPALSDFEIAEKAGKGIYERRCRMNATFLVPFLSANNLGNLRTDVIPEVSIIIIVRNNFEQTANCMISALQNTNKNVEFVILDNASVDKTSKILKSLHGVKYIRSESNLGFTIAVNVAVSHSRGKYIVLLNNDIELGPRAIDQAVHQLEQQSSVGVVGGKVLRMHGRLQEAGCVIWRDGTCIGYGRDADPYDGQFNISYDVDFCSGCFLALRKIDWERLEGFDEGYAPAYYEEVDYCVRVWNQGQRVLYDPSILIWHYEYGSSSLREEPLALMRKNQRYFVNKHRRFLSECLTPHNDHLEQARLRRVGRRRVLFIEDKIPDPKKGMGYSRSALISSIIANNVDLITIIGLHENNWIEPSFSSKEGKVEIVTRVNINTIAEFLKSRTGVYEIVWLSRTHNLSHLKRWREQVPEFFNRTKVVLDTEAIAAPRQQAYALHSGQQVDLSGLLNDEFQDIEIVNEICAVSGSDERILKDFLTERDIGAKVNRISYAVSPDDQGGEFETTDCIVLTGSFSQLEGPNADGLLWFDREVRPLLALNNQLKFVIAGHEAQRFYDLSAFQHHYLIIDSPSSMDCVYKMARIVVAPTRFAAGIPVKVIEAAGAGVPVVMTSLLAEQLEWKSDGICYTAPAAPDFARMIEAVAMDRDTWNYCKKTQTNLIRDKFSLANFENSIFRSIGGSKASLQQSPQRPNVIF